jgi:NodT family efflux transporter outer membrane factor (OMF) lipoprotein
VTLLGEVARNYISVRGVQERQWITRRSIRSRRNTLEVVEARFKAGLTNELDVTRARAALAATESQLPLLETLLKQGMHRLSVLLGQPPGTLAEELGPVASIPDIPPEVSVGLPSDLLRRRADIRGAERQLAAATAQIGVATADLFPKFTLFGTAGVQSLDFTNWFTRNSQYWSAGPSLNWAVFDIGRTQNKIRAAEAAKLEALTFYEKTVLEALEDVENALVAYSREQTRYRSLREAVSANRLAVQLSNDLYAQGLIDFLNVLDAERALFLSEDELSQSRQTVSLNLVTMYKALGGGWDKYETEAPDIASAEKEDEVHGQEDLLD